MRNTGNRSGEDAFPAINLHRDSYVPYYQQIANQVRHYIKSHKDGGVGRSFWSEGEIATRLEVSKMTVRQAFQILRGEGLLVIEKGRRPVIGSGLAGKNFQELQGFTEEMLRRGMKPSSKLLAMEISEPDPDTARALRLKRHQKVFSIQRLRFTDGQMVGLETTHLPYHFFHGIEKHDLGKVSLYTLIEEHYGISLSWSEEELQAIAATEKEASLLKIPPGFPLFRMRRTVFDTRDTPIERGVSLFRGDRYSAIVVSHRKPEGGHPTGE
ncbi:MAG TPA: GntR family transcriptional regulator [Terriglobia bacterium]|nr:GntR family transcriptional regulator [Terriglobia bacterium]